MRILVKHQKISLTPNCGWRCITVLQFYCVYISNVPNHSFQFHRYISNQKRLLTINEDHMKYYSNLRNLWVSEIFMPNVNETAELMWAYAVSHRTVTNTHLTYVSTMAFFNNSKLQYLWGFFCWYFIKFNEIIKQILKCNKCSILLFFIFN